MSCWACAHLRSRVCPWQRDHVEWAVVCANKLGVQLVRKKNEGAASFTAPEQVVPLRRVLNCFARTRAAPLWGGREEVAVSR